GNAPSLPDSELIRREALQRSWQRDQEVAARRLRIRWAVWALCRYGLPLILVLGTAIAVWIWALPQLRTTLATLAGPAAPTTENVGPVNALPATPPVPIEAPATPPPVDTPEPTDVPPTPSGPSDGAQDPIELRPEGGVSSSSNGDQGQDSLEDAGITHTPDPVLKPDTGLQSKEP
ncbi:MAG TPA: hypothetical protein VFY22_15090, partial [Hydrogenophaga sp.]|nr:hypothetical protein [Hydrogenophaga sp.]